MRRGTLAAAGGAALLAPLLGALLGGCAGIDAGPADADPSASPTAARLVQRTTTGTTPATAPTKAQTSSGVPAVTKQRITLAFAGDVHFADHVAALLDAPKEGLAELTPLLGAPDIAMVNLETAITERGSAASKRFVFRAPATALDALAAAGVDVVSSANNHAVDYGSTGLRDTLAAKKAGTVPMAGIGANAAEAFRPVVLTRHGVQVALLAATQVQEETVRDHSADESTAGVASAVDRTRLRAAVRAAAARYDLVVVMMHWGREGTTCASELQADTARELADDGADLIVGAHAHRQQGAGWLGPAYVAYGLGNFIWYNTREASARSGVLTVTVDAAAARAQRGNRDPERRSVVTKATWTPLSIRSDGVPRPPRSDAARERLMDAWNDSVRCSGLATTRG